MPNKLQLKTLSNSGELLNVINCTAGRISVFRGNTPADLRPYQRALIGTSGKEKMVIAVDGAGYDLESHNIIGLGEAPPHAGLTVREFLGKAGVSDAALDGMLNSFGLESTADSKVSSLSPDQDRRVRILGAVAQPERALIINEPFEVITSQWKERFAEVLLDFARMKNGLVIIPSLSYRPESWIDNSLIARIEVGQSIQRTIGFGQAGSEANQMIEELRRKLQEDEAQERGSRRGAAVAASAAAAVMSGTLPSDPSPPSDYAMIKSWLFGGESKAFKAVSSLLAAAIGVGTALIVMDAGRDPEPPKPDVVAAVQPGKPSTPSKQAPSNTGEKPLDAQKQQGSGAAAINRPVPPQSVGFVLDEYPEAIRSSIIDTAHGIAGKVADPAEDRPAPQDSGESKSGNLYSLMEKASSDSASPGSSYQQQPTVQDEPQYNEGEDVPVESVPEDQSQEDQKREEIRAKFLEAIRAAAERRESTMEEE